MRPKTLAVLAVLVVALAAFVWFFEREMPSTEESQEQAKKVFGSLEVDDVDGVLVDWDDQQVEMVRTRKTAEGETTGGGGEWRLQSPLRARADTTAVEGLIRRLADLEKKRTLAGVSPVEYGLEPPAGRVQLSTAGGEEILEIGRQVPASKDRVVQVTGRKALYVVGDSFTADLGKAPGDWRSKELFAGSRQDIDRMTLVEGDRKVLLARRGPRFWIESPLSDLASDDEVQSLLGQITGLRAARFLDQPPDEQDLGLAPPAGVIEVVLKDQETPFRAEWGGAVPDQDGRHYARVGEQVVETTATLDTALDRSPEEWRSRKWTEVASYQIDAVKADTPEGALVLTRDQGEWKRGEDQIAFSPVSDLLEAVTGAEASELLGGDEGKGVTSGEPRYSFVLTDDDGEETTLALYVGDDGTVAGTVADREVVLRFEPGLADSVAAKLKAIRETSPVDQKGAEAESDSSGGS